MSTTEQAHTDTNDDSSTVSDVATPDLGERQQQASEEDQPRGHQERTREPGTVSELVITTINNRPYTSFLVVALIMMVVSGFFLLLPHVPNKEERAAGAYEREQKAAADEAVQLVNNWLQDQRRGRNGFTYWDKKSHVRFTRLHSVRSWEVVKVETFGSTAEIAVIIKSSTQRGMPITKTCKVKLRPDDQGQLKIYELLGPQ